MIKAIFFDVDDTMYDHLIPFKQAIAEYVTHIHSFPFEEAYHRMRYYSDTLSVQYGGADVMVKLGIDKKMQAERFKYALADFAIEISFEQAQQIQTQYLATQFNISLFSGMDSLIVKLKKRGYIVGLLTNGAEHHQRKKIEALHLHQLIDKELIFISGAFGIDKPDPAIFKHISKSINVDEIECLYVGDSWRNDVVGALSANWQMVWFNHRKTNIPDKTLHINEVTSVTDLYTYFEKYN